MDKTRVWPSETLYRAVKNGKPQLWNEAAGRPTSALFKDSFGCSVDRDGDRTIHQVVDTFMHSIESYNLKAVVSVSAQECFELPANVYPAPTDTNEFHAEIHDIDKPELHKNKARALSKNAIIVYP